MEMLMYLKNVWNEYLEIMIMDSMGRDRELSTFKADFHTNAPKIPVNWSI